MCINFFVLKISTYYCVSPLDNTSVSPSSSANFSFADTIRYLNIFCPLMEMEIYIYIYVYISIYQYVPPAATWKGQHFASTCVYGFRIIRTMSSDDFPRSINQLDFVNTVRLQNVNFSPKHNIYVLEEKIQWPIQSLSLLQLEQKMPLGILLLSSHDSDLETKQLPK